MTFDFKTYLYFLYLLLSKREMSFHWVLLFVRNTVRPPFVFAITSVFNLFDNIFFVKFRKQEIRSPIFIVGTPRCGSTFLFRLMCKDEERFTYFKLYDIIFPSICVRKFINVISVIDRLLNFIITNLVDKFQEKLFKEQYHLHEFGFRNAEEDDMHFIHCFHTPVIFLLFPFAEELNRLAFFDKNLDLKDQKKYMSFYEGCVRRQIYFTGSNKSLLSKNVWGLGKFKALKREFSDAKFIYIVRNPYDSIGSFLSYYYFLLKKFDSRTKISSQLSMKVVDVLCNLYLYAELVIPELDESSFLIVKYDEMVCDPGKAVENIYNRFGMSIETDYMEFLKNETEKSIKYKSKHCYSLEQFGVKKDFVYNRLSTIFKKYNFAK